MKRTADIIPVLLACFFVIFAAFPLGAQSPANDLKVDSLTPSAPVAPDGPLTPDIKLDTDVVPAPGKPAASGSKDPATANPVIPGLEDSNILGEDLTQEEKEKFVRLLQEAAELVGGIRIQEALERILEAERIYPDFFALYNIKGAAYTKVRDFEKATACFEKCLELNPESTEARFNLAEMSFVQKDFDAALGKFRKLLADNPRFPARTRNLVRYKIYLVLLKSGKTEEAEKLLSEFNYMSDTPEYYFANAAKAFEADDKAGARDWLKSASRIYDRSLQDLFVDSLVELGYIETL